MHSSRVSEATAFKAWVTDLAHVWNQTLAASVCFCIGGECERQHIHICSQHGTFTATLMISWTCLATSVPARCWLGAQQLEVHICLSVSQPPCRCWKLVVCDVSYLAASMVVFYFGYLANGTDTRSEERRVCAIIS